MDDVLKSFEKSLDRSLNDRLKSFTALDTELRELKTKQLLDFEDLSRLKNESVMVQDLINGMNMMVESTRIEADSLKKKQLEFKKDLNSEVEQLRKEMRQGGAKHSGVSKKTASEEEKKEEGVPHAEFVKV